MASEHFMVCHTMPCDMYHWFKRFFDTAAKRILKKNVKIGEIVLEFIVSNNVTRELYIIEDQTKSTCLYFEYNKFKLSLDIR